MKHWSLGFTLIVCTSLLSCGEVEEEGGIPAGSHPVIVVAVDGLRADALGCYGNLAAETPNFDALAGESVRFDWAFTQAPDPAVSLASLLTGLYPTTAGVRLPGERLPDEAQTLAEAVATDLSTAAFLEGAAGGNDYGLAQGFGQFYLGPNPGAEALPWLGDHSDDDFVAVFRGWTAGWQLGRTVDDVEAPEGFFERLQQVLASDASDEPLPLDPADVEFARALYSDRVRSIDTALGEFMAELRGSGLTERATLVLLGTSGLDLDQHGPTGSLSLHSTVTRVPLFIRFPGGGVVQTIDKIVELVDVLPTLLDLLGTEIPIAIQGQSLVPLVTDQGKPPYLAFAESPTLGGQRAIALGGYRLVQVGEAARLYDLSADPLELEDIAENEVDRVDVMLRHLGDWQKMVSVASLDPNLRSEEELDPETLERLKSLGYIH